MKRAEAIEWAWLFVIGALALVLFQSWADIIKCVLSHSLQDTQLCCYYAVFITAFILGLIGIVLLYFYAHYP